MSPARSRVGPLVGLSPTPISSARMRQSVVLPSPGGPSSRMWSSGSPRCLAACDEDPEVLLERLLPDELVERAGPERGLVVPGVGLGVERMLTELPETGGPRDVLGRLASSALVPHGEVVHLLRAQRLLPIRRNASFMYFSTDPAAARR